MADYTTNYNLKKPAQEDFYNVDDFNGNMDILDSQIPTEIQGVKDWTKENFANESLAINSDFKIWQRGTSFDISSLTHTYTADHWKRLEQNGLKVEKVEKGVRLTVETNTLQCRFAQPLSDLELKQNKVTISAICNTSHNNSFMLHIDYNKLSDGSRVQKYMPITINDSFYEENLTDVGSISLVGVQTIKESSVIGATLDIEYIKPEYGSVATLFVPRSYTEELALCQSYFQIIKFGTRIRMGYFLDDSIDFYYLIQEMRAIPTFVLHGTQGVDYAVRTLNGTVQTGFTFTQTLMSKTQFGLKATKIAHGLTDGQLAIMSASGEIWLDAEIY